MEVQTVGCLLQGLGFRSSFGELKIASLAPYKQVIAEKLNIYFISASLFREKFILSTIVIELSRTGDWFPKMHMTKTAVNCNKA